MSAAGRPPAKGTDGSGTGNDHGNVISVHELIRLPGLDTNSNPTRPATVLPLGILWQVLKVLEKMGPDAE